MILNIATYNIHKGVSWFRQQPRIHGIRHALDELNVDLLFLQEVQGQHTLRAARHAQWPIQGQHEFLAGDRHQSAYGKNANYRHGHHGNALLSRFPILHSQNQDVSDHRFEERGILHCVVQMQDQTVHCYVVHLGLFSSGRRRQTSQLISMIRDTTPDQTPLLIAGDFNDWQNHLSATLRKELGVQEVFDHLGDHIVHHPAVSHKIRHPHPKAALTFPVGAPFLALDRIYVRGMHINSAQVLQGAPWSGLSDHAPLLAALEL